LRDGHPGAPRGASLKQRERKGELRAYREGALTNICNTGPALTEHNVTIGDTSPCKTGDTGVTTLGYVSTIGGPGYQQLKRLFFDEAAYWFRQRPTGGSLAALVAAVPQ
jgi:hypothetical protein